MEITIEDLKFFKISPTLIFLIKAIYIKDDDLISELDNICGITQMAKHLEDKMILKIVSGDIKSSSYEIRNLETLRYLNEEKHTIESDIDEVLNYFKEITGQNRVSIKSQANRKFINARLKEGYSIQDLKDVALLKTEQWKNDPKMRQYIRVSTFYNNEKFQAYIGEISNIKIKDFSDDI